MDRPVRHVRRPADPASIGRRPHRRERGVALVEFALIAPLLFGLLFGIIDFGHVYTRTLDVRHGAREAARLAAVNYTGGVHEGDAQRAAIVSETCRRMDGGKGATVELAFVASGSGDPDGTVGEAVRVTVRRPMTSLTGFYGPMLDGKSIRSEVEIRIEVPATFTTGSGTCS